MQENTAYSILTGNHDWHVTLGHPSDAYIKEMLRSGRIKGKFTKSSACNVCKHAKIKNRPHSKRLPMVTTPFYKLHMDTLQISPPTRKGYQYVDYVTSSNEIATIVRQPEAQLPKAVNPNITLKTSKNKYPPSVSEKHLQNSFEEQEQTEPIPANVNQELVTNKHYQYVPYYKEPEKHISRSVSSDNIIEGKQIRKNPDRLFLTDLVPYTQAMKDPIEKDK
ncbi:hypothetical protein O181_096813 [Austropuccinia psidii MF-1]|uniref:GAG-pre-integrase domain-containing protein n=1 Tax=Austropuccinia psidii MF-1 TaxID=1389203 RepID=A0A9Q3J7P4_9BASI|nr:hypothetical protein [Austropuccinia psidii MF-1]